MEITKIPVKPVVISPVLAQQSGQAIEAIRLPPLPTVLAGGLGGPFCIFLLTPLRNALTVASQDRSLGVIGIYKETLGISKTATKINVKSFGAVLSRGWAGGIYPALPAIPQFLVLGPCYHALASATNPYLALVLTGFTETTISFGSNARNAEEAYRRRIGAQQSIRPIPIYNFWGSGVVPHFLRNTIAMAGVRVLSPMIKSKTECNYVMADFGASMITGALSMPFNQLFNFYAVEDWKRRQSPTTYIGKPTFKDGLDFIKKQYLGGSSTLARDVIIRSVYATFLFGIYAGIERELIERHKLNKFPFHAFNQT
jgi:hypothetical protein